jgi:GntR family transcriptional regulator/MocR family aminotransferase
MSLPIPLERDSDRTLQEQIYHFIRSRALDGRYRTGLQLPSTRELGTSLGISRKTVVLAYDWLASEGYIETRRGSGTFICRIFEAPAVVVDGGDDAVGRGLRPPVVLDDLRLPPARPRVRPSLDFYYGRPDPRQFPIKAWRALISEHLGQFSAQLSEYGAPGGLPDLREAIAEHLAIAKGMSVDPACIVITAGAQDGLSVICRLLVTPGMPVAVEDPGYAPASRLLASNGARICPIPVDRDGIVASAIDGTAARLIYVTPSHQFPSGVVMSLQRRRELLAAAEAQGAYVVEDDYDGEIIFDRPPLAALAALDRDRRVIYVGSFSKTIGAGIRLGFLVLPPELAAPAAAAKTLASNGQAWLEQAVLASFIRRGSFQNHVRRMRIAYRARRDALIGALHDWHGEGIGISGEDAGMHLMCVLPPSVPDAHAIAASARSVDVGLYTPADASVMEFARSDAPERRLILGYGALTPDEIVLAIRRVRSVC